MNRLQQQLLIERFLHKIDGTGLHGPDTHRHVGIGSHEDDREPDAPLGQQVLKLESAGSRHAYIQQQAARAAGLMPNQKLLR